ncbi:hypothetical protein HUU05_02870 [candidate division KSB1 bacterium]|nr:hypothetical protein [candidate division KSB1 bacterium]
MKFRRLCLSLLPAFLLAVGCSKNSTAPEANEVENLSDTEQMTIVATEVAQASGGAMNDLTMVAANANGSFNALGKSAGFDTTISKGWITYSLSLSYFTERGVPQNNFVKGVTDSVVYSSSLSGNYSEALGKINIGLKSGSNLIADGLKSGNATVNGGGANNSTYSFEGNRRTLNINAASFYTVSNVVIPLNGSSYIPSAGTLEGTIKGKFTAVGAQQSAEKEYSFTFTVVFNGNNQVTVTLPSGKQYTLNLTTGKYN